MKASLEKLFSSLGLRGRDSGVGANKIGLFGGLVNIDEEVRFETMALQEGRPIFSLLDFELVEELGVPMEILKEQSQTKLFSLARDERFSTMS